MMPDFVHQLLEKAPTGITGLDEIVEGGLPRGRTTLVCGGPGCGKTLLATEFLVRGAERYDEPGVFMTFEENTAELITNAASLGMDLQGLIDQNKIMIDYIFIERSQIEETGDYDLEGLFIRLSSAIQAIGAKRVVLDTIETLFAGFSNEATLRAELRRLFRWMKEKGLTAIVTGERGEKTLTRYGLEEYISDCVIFLENRVINKLSNRILRVVKYRGSGHGKDEYPFLINNQGFWVQPITSLGLDYGVSSDHISTGIPDLDQMLNGQGVYRGSSVMISGTAGTGKTSLAVSMVDAACRRGERCLYLAFEEATGQIVRNMRSIGIDLQPWVDQGLLQFHAARPTFYSLEMHLLTIQKLVFEFKPSVVVVDPLTNLVSIASESEVKSLLVRLIDFLKKHQITALFNSLTAPSQNDDSPDVGVSSLMDTWILVRSLERNGERIRGLYILKSRGMPHSAQVREFKLTGRGIALEDVYGGPTGGPAGPARIAGAEEAQARAARQHRELEYKHDQLARQLAELQAEIASQETASIQAPTNPPEQSIGGEKWGQAAPANQEQHAGSTDHGTSTQGEDSNDAIER